MLNRMTVVVLLQTIQTNSGEVFETHATISATTFEHSGIKIQTPNESVVGLINLLELQNAFQNRMPSLRTSFSFRTPFFLAGLGAKLLFTGFAETTTVPAVRFFFHPAFLGLDGL
jgi:hypothetical protein